MYVIAVYDMDVKRVGKMLKLTRRYLNWIQNSVFEGELTEAGLLEYKAEAKALMNPKTDSLIIFTSREEKWLKKEVIGKEKNSLDIFL